MGSSCLPGSFGIGVAEFVDAIDHFQIGLERGQQRPFKGRSGGLEQIAGRQPPGL